MQKWLICLVLNIGSMLVVLALKHDVECTSQRLKWLIRQADKRTNWQGRTDGQPDFWFLFQVCPFMFLVSPFMFHVCCSLFVHFLLFFILMFSVFPFMFHVFRFQFFYIFPSFPFHVFYFSMFFLIFPFQVPCFSLHVPSFSLHVPCFSLHVQCFPRKKLITFWFRDLQLNNSQNKTTTWERCLDPILSKNNKCAFKGLP